MSDCYVGIAPCGCMVSVIVVSTRHSIGDLIDSLNEFRDICGSGELRIGTASTEEVHEKLGCTHSEVEP